MKRACVRGLLLALVAALLASCSAMRFAYNNSQGLIRFEADQYFDFDSAQEADFRDRLARFHGWHRETELPAYAALLQVAAGRLAAGITGQDVTWAISTLRARYRAGAAKAVEDAAPVLASVRERQIRTLEKKLAESNRKFEKEFLSGEAHRQHLARTRRMWERFRDWTGELSDAQEARIERFVREQARYTALRFEDRKRVQRDAVALLKKRLEPADLAAPLAALFIAPEKRRSADYLQAAARWEAALVVLIVDLDRMLSPEQRDRVVKRVEAFAEDFRVLAGEHTMTRAAAGN